MRISISKKHHQALLLEIAQTLGTDDPKDALEHLLNCWLVPCHQTPAPQFSAPQQSENDDLSALANW